MKPKKVFLFISFIKSNLLLIGSISKQYQDWDKFHKQV